MARLLWLPDVLRAAGLTVHEVPGWRTRGGEAIDARGLICHDTGGSATSSDAGEIRVLLEGSTTAPAPIAQLYLSRSGEYTIVASGLCFHALNGWGGPLQGLGNRNLIGIEAAANPGRAWPAAQLDAYTRGVAAICRHLRWDPHRHVAAHREHQPGAKVDPAGIDMARFRADVARLLEEDDVALSPEQERHFLALIWRVKALIDGRDTVEDGPTKGEKVARPSAGTVQLDPAAEERIARRVTALVLAALADVHEAASHELRAHEEIVTGGGGTPT